MKKCRLAGLLVLSILTAVPQVRADGDDAPLFRVFLKDGGSLVSYGELARLDDRVVFSMPTTASADNPELQLVSIASDRIDWERTTSYAESARANRYIATRAESDYTALTTTIAQALNDVSLTENVATRLGIVERARRELADWPAAHFNYKADEIRQMLTVLDEAIAELRATAGIGQFNLNFVAASAPPPPPTAEPLLPPPTPKEAIEQTLLAARLTASPAERTSLMAVALSNIDRNAAALPSAWVDETKTTIKTQIAHEVELDRSYQTMGTRMLGIAQVRARNADVRGVQRLIDRIHERDDELGGERPDAVNALVAAVEDQLDAARRLRLARDRWALRQPAFQRYQQSIASAVARLVRLQPSLEDIKTLAGSAPAALDALQHAAELIGRNISLVEPPEEFRNAHALLASAAQLALTAASIRREATLAGDLSRAWDASSAAAGAMMLTTRAQTEMQSVSRLPQLSR
ncbi:MAG TPA: hypothetical protein VH417_11525 [Vicinamibacterales bacterium]|jgi:hypothetical protein